MRSVAARGYESEFIVTSPRYPLHVHDPGTNMDFTLVDPMQAMRLSFVYQQLEHYLLINDCMALKVDDNEYRVWANFRNIQGDLPCSGTIGSGNLDSAVFGSEFQFSTLHYRQSTQRDCLIFRCYRDN